MLTHHNTVLFINVVLYKSVVQIKNEGAIVSTYGNAFNDGGDGVEIADNASQSSSGSTSSRATLQLHSKLRYTRTGIY